MLVTVKRGWSNTIRVWISSPTNRDITIQKRCVIGSLNNITSMVTVADVTSQFDDHLHYEVDVQPRQADELWDPPVELPDFLSTDEKAVVGRVLREECQAFAHNDNDVGFAPDLQ